MIILIRPAEYQSNKVVVDSQTTISIVFDKPFTKTPTVVVTLQTDQVGVTATVKNVSLTGFTVDFSSSFTGIVNYRAANSGQEPAVPEDVDYIAKYLTSETNDLDGLVDATGIRTLRYAAEVDSSLTGYGVPSVTGIDGVPNTARDFGYGGDADYFTDAVNTKTYQRVQGDLTIATYVKIDGAINPDDGSVMEPSGLEAILAIEDTDGMDFTFSATYNNEQPQILWHTDENWNYMELDPFYPDKGGIRKGARLSAGAWKSLIFRKQQVSPGIVNVKLSLDGVLIAERTNVQDFFFTYPNDLKVIVQGSDSNGGLQWGTPCVMSSLEVFDKYLTDAEVTTHASKVPQFDRFNVLENDLATFNWEFFRPTPSAVPLKSRGNTTSVLKQFTGTTATNSTTSVTRATVSLRGGMYTSVMRTNATGTNFLADSDLVMNPTWIYYTSEINDAMKAGGSGSIAVEVIGSIPAGTRLLDLRGGPPQSFWFFLDITGTGDAAAAFGSSTAQITATGGVTLNTMGHYVFNIWRTGGSQGGAEVKVYKNGTQSATNGVSTSYTVADKNLGLYRVFQTVNAAGDVLLLRVYPRALTTQEIADLYTKWWA